MLTARVATPRTVNTVVRPMELMKPTEMLPMMRAETPKPIMSTPEEKPTLSGNHWLVVAAMVL